MQAGRDFVEKMQRRYPVLEWAIWPAASPFCYRSKGLLTASPSALFYYSPGTASLSMDDSNRRRRTRTTWALGMEVDNWWNIPGWQKHTHCCSQSASPSLDRIGVIGGDKAWSWMERISRHSTPRTKLSTLLWLWFPPLKYSFRCRRTLCLKFQGMLLKWRFA